MELLIRLHKGVWLQMSNQFTECHVVNANTFLILRALAFPDFMLRETELSY